MKKTSYIFLFTCIYASLVATAFGEIQKEQQPYMLTLEYIKGTHGALSESFLQKLIGLFNAEIFIETGTYLGKTTENAARHFKEAHTIELSPQLAQQAQQYLNAYSNVYVYCGDSTTVLPQILKHLTKRIFFWLDGHYSWGDTALGHKYTPIIEELAAIERSGIKDSIILIDDIRCFQKASNSHGNDALKDYPSMEELEQAIIRINKDYQFYVYGDAALAFPASDNVIVSPVIQACTISRLSETKQINTEKIVAAETIIAQATGDEQKTLKTLVDLFTSQRGIGGHYYLWYALILDHQGDIENAKILERKANSLGVYRHRQ